jgi:hypothetical protein
MVVYRLCVITARSEFALERVADVDFDMCIVRYLQLNDVSLPRTKSLEAVHNPDRYMSDLRQILSQGRKRIGLLIGAGAPISVRVSGENKLDGNGRPLIPGVDELTSLVIDGLSDDKQRFAAKQIRSELGSAANVETILSRVRLLQQALGNVEVHGLDSSGYAELGRTICQRIGTFASIALPSERNAYNELVAWISGTLRSHAVEIFTTNYDLLLEEAFEGVRAPYFDGFAGGSSPFFDPVTVAGDDLPPRWSRLWKLHGSVGWSLANQMVVRGGSREAVELIYPDHLKYDLTQKQPYTALFERLKRFILTPDTLLLAVGFSFRDAHVCAVLDEALAVNANAAVFAFQFGALAQEEAACKIALDRPNFSVYGRDGAVINGVGGAWRPGELPKNWKEIRSSFWGTHSTEVSPYFLLGDFKHFSRFCALTHSLELERVESDSPTTANE